MVCLLYFTLHLTFLNSALHMITFWPEALGDESVDVISNANAAISASSNGNLHITV